MTLNCDNFSRPNTKSTNMFKSSYLFNSDQQKKCDVLGQL
jgi:hypothetical protein